MEENLNKLFGGVDEFIASTPKGVAIVGKKTSILTMYTCLVKSLYESGVKKEELIFALDLAEMTNEKIKKATEEIEKDTIKLSKDIEEKIEELLKKMRG